MRIRCKNPRCNQKIDFRVSFVRFEDDVFCSNDCAIVFVEDNRKLREVGSRFHSPEKKRLPIYFGTQEDHGDCDPLPHAPPIQT